MIQPQTQSLLTFGCKHCKTQAAMTKAFTQHLAYAIAEAGDAAILPDFIRCGWCRRKITAEAAGFDFSAQKNRGQ
jgi:hypothetical protein